MSLEPSALLVDHTDVLREVPAGRALDLACGNGRNSFFLASLGYEVTAVDFSEPVVHYVERRAAELGVQVAVHETDVSELDPGTEVFSVVSNFMFVDRNLAPRIIRSLIPGGFLFFENLTVAERDVLGREIRREFLLETNEALHLFAPLQVIFYQEGIMTAEGGQAKPRAVAQLIARRPFSPVAGGATSPSLAAPRNE